MSSITPTIGHKVWVWSGEGHVVGDAKQAFDGSIIFVNEDGTINVTFHDHAGHGPHVALMVEIRDPSETDAHSIDGTPMKVYATWMPYQVKQAPTA